MKIITHIILFVFYFSISSFAQNDEKAVDTTHIKFCGENPTIVYFEGKKTPDSISFITRRSPREESTIVVYDICFPLPKILQIVDLIKMPSIIIGLPANFENHEKSLNTCKDKTYLEYYKIFKATE